MSLNIIPHISDTQFMNSSLSKQYPKGALLLLHKRNPDKFKTFGKLAFMILFTTNKYQRFYVDVAKRKLCSWRQC